MLRFVVWENVAFGCKAVVLERVKGIAENNRAPMPPVYRGLVKIDIPLRPLTPRASAAAPDG